MARSSGLPSRLVNPSRYDKRITVRELDRANVRGRVDFKDSDRVAWASVVEIAGRERAENGVLTEPQTRLTRFLPAPNLGYPDDSVLAVVVYHLVARART